MFERLMVLAAAAAAERAARRRELLARRLREAAPAGVAVSQEAGGVVLSGRGLGQRMALEAELRWLVAESRDDG